jgi:hypothetical protein
MEIIKLQELQNNFNSAIESSTNSKLIIENEIVEVKHFVNSIPNTKTWIKPNIPNFTHKATKIFNLNISVHSKSLFNEAFYGFQLNGNFNTDKQFHETEEVYKLNLEVIKQAFEFLEYYKWLNDLLATPLKAEKKNDLSLNQKILALDYLGVDLTTYDKTKTAKILSAILGMNEQNIRESLTYINIAKNEIRTAKNLKVVSQLFENQSFFDVSKIIKQDIEKLL